MSFGLRVWDSAGRTVIDTTYVGGVYAGTVQASVGSSGSMAFPDLTGRQVRTYNTGAGGHNFSVTYPGGVPTISWTPRPRQRTPSVALVFAI